MGVAFVEPKRIITQVRKAEKKTRCEDVAFPGAFQGCKEKQGIIWVGGSHGGKHTFTVVCASQTPAAAQAQ